MDDKNFVAAIEKLYEASLSPECWVELMEFLQTNCESQVAALITQKIDGRDTQAHSIVGVDDKFMLDYSEYYAGLSDIIPHAMTFSPGSIYRDEMFPRHKQYLNGEVCTDLWRPNGMEHLLTLILEKTNERCRYISLRRGADAGLYSKSESDFMQRLYPHFLQAVRVNTHLSSSTGLQRGLMETFDKVKVGVVILSEAQEAIFVNKSAKIILDQYDGLCLSKEGKLRAASIDENDRLAALTGHSGLSLKKMDIDPFDMKLQPGGSMRIDRPSGKRPFGVLVAPLGQNSIEKTNLAAMNQPTSMVFIKDAEADMQMTAQSLSAVMPLSPAEAKLTVLLCHGVNLKEAAQNLGLRESTVRSQLKSIFQKTDTNSQAGLVRHVLLTMPNQ